MSSTVALYIPSFAGGGAQRVVLDLARAFAERGLNADLVACRAKGPYLDEVASGVRVVDLGAPRVSVSLAALVSYMRRERPQAMLSTLEHANVVALWARRLARVSTRLVIREANTRSQAYEASRPLRARLVPYLMRRSYPWADAVVAVSHGVADDLVHAVGLPRHAVRVIYNPVSVSSILVKARAPLEQPWLAANQPPVILGVGRLTAQKDFPTLMHAFAQVRRCREARLIVLGEGNDRDALVALAQRLGVADCTLLPGFVENPYAYMARSAVFVLSSAWEGLPNVLIQAMVCGCPIVSTDCHSGPAEILDGGRYGKLVPPRNPRALASAILDTLRTPPRLDTHTQVTRFSEEQIVAEYLQVLGLTASVPAPKPDVESTP